MIERERKFLVVATKLPSFVTGALAMDDQEVCRQMRTGYFTRDGIAIRASVGNVGRHNPKSRICFKGPGLESREEFEYEIPLDDAIRLVELAPYKINKSRIEFEGREIDSFEGGGILAEWEYHDGKGDPVLPVWLGKEVTNDPDYTNQQIAVRGFKTCDTPSF